MTVLVDGLTDTVDTVDVAAPVTEVVAGVNIIGWLADVVAVTILTLPAVVALPVNAPLNVVAVIVPVDGFMVTVDTVELATPESVPDVGVKMIG